MSETVAKTVDPVTETEVIYWARSPYFSCLVSSDPGTWGWYTDKGYSIEKSTTIKTRINEVVAFPSSAEKSEK